MNKEQYYLNDFDQEFWNQQLEGFVPKKIFDIHTHLWTEHNQKNADLAESSLRLELDFTELCKWNAALYPGRNVDCLAVGTPVSGMDCDKYNKWLSDQVNDQINSRASMLITPDISPEKLLETLRNANFAGVKPYFIFAKNPQYAEIKDFFPESQMEVVNDMGKAVTLHLSMPTGIAAKENMTALRYFTGKYPRIKWILAHCARGFNPIFLEKAIHELRDIPNIWYDTSAVNDLYSHILLLKYENIKRIMFGSDNVASACLHGKYIAYGKSWTLFKTETQNTLIIYEQLLQQKRAFSTLGLSDSDVHKVFYQNAEELLFQISEIAN